MKIGAIPATLACRTLSRQACEEVVMDVLSDVLQTLRLSGSLFFVAEMRSPWSIASPPSDQVALALEMQPQWIVLFHVVAEGGCHVELDAQRSVWLDAGDVVILPRCDAHVMASTPRHARHPTPIAALLPGLPLPQLCRLLHGDGADTTTRLVCGYLEAQERFAPLAQALPPLLCVRTSEQGAYVEAPDGHIHAIDRSSPAAAWMESSFRYAAHEAREGRPGAVTMLGRLAELLFVQVLRGYVEHSDHPDDSWLAGLRDPYVGPALQLLHERPERSWTVDALGREVGLSRSALGERFARMLGQPPMRYLAAWRMQLARNLMRDPSLGLADIATRVGYDSEAAFHRAFKRDLGEPPATWRKRHVPTA